MSAATPVRVGLWGLGSHGERNLLPAFTRAAGVHLAAIHTRNVDVLTETCNQLGVRAHSDPEDLLTSEDIDVVYLAIPTGHHREQGARVLEAGKHLWCEKPLTADLRQTQELIDLAHQQGLTVRETDMFLHHPQVAMARSAANRHGFDRLVTLTARFGFPHLDPSNFRYSASDGGGALLDAGYYPIAAAVAWLGLDVTLGGALLEVDDSRGVDVGGSAFLTEEAGTAFLDWGFGRSYRNEIDLWFDGGVMSLERAFSKPADLVTRIRIRTQGGEEETVDVPAADQFALMFESFAADLGSSPDMGATVRRAELISEIRASASVVTGD